MVGSCGSPPITSFVAITISGGPLPSSCAIAGEVTISAPSAPSLEILAGKPSSGWPFPFHA